MSTSRNDAWDMILRFFDGDTAKTDLWFTTKNPLLGNASPDEMIQSGRYDKLLCWVRQQLAENESPKR